MAHKPPPEPKGLFAIPDFDWLLGKCACVDIFQFGTGRPDQVYAAANDLGSTAVDCRALRRVQSKPMTVDEEQLFAAVLKQIDTNHDGKMSREEIKKHFRQHHSPMREDELNEMIDIADKDKSGFIEVSEFQSLCQKIMMLSRSTRGGQMQ
eukprot:gnl/TRDRNA2_/TRDRNA2_41103_c0_seq1.p1 gnl/TRDRNA2_/TRDRNA2_41103_c0~~gnl/TRDRNA2_/TRDRNA2_41103_c0_seq1.p1  ORF type:complete len:151 (-),score=26.26 gnl/TRDRNA2_/TRDRNA2_41103_c0_seq1:137-589(-)